MPRSVILFYKYAPLTNERETMSILRDAYERLGVSLRLTGRVLLGLSADAEGTNGTLSGDKDDVAACARILLGRDRCGELDTRYSDCAAAFFTSCERFAVAAGVPPPYFDGAEDFKWSAAGGSGEIFPDLNVKVVKEVISTGRKLSTVKLGDTRQGYLTPEQWHEELQRLQSPEGGERPREEGDTILVDCRNHKEFEIGRFEGAMDPNTKTFAQFPRWVEQNRAGLAGKKVLMYCTGGTLSRPHDACV